MITSDDLRIEELRLKYVELIERPDVFPTRSNWEFITKNALPGLAKGLYRKYLTAITVDDNDRQELHDIAIEEFPKFLAAIDRNEAVEAVYDDISTSRSATLKLIRDNGLFNAGSMTKLLCEGEIEFVLSILDVYQPFYEENDLNEMEELLKNIDLLPQIGKIEYRSGIFGRSERFICPEGHSNPADAEYCTHTNCGKNARGLTLKQEEAVNLFSKRIDALKSLLRKKVSEKNSDIPL